MKTKIILTGLSILSGVAIYAYKKRQKKKLAKKEEIIKPIQTEAKKQDLKSEEKKEEATQDNYKINLQKLPKINLEKKYIKRLIRVNKNMTTFRLSLKTHELFYQNDNYEFYLNKAYQTVICLPKLKSNLIIDDFNIYLGSYTHFKNNNMKKISLKKESRRVKSEAVIKEVLPGEEAEAEAEEKTNNLNVTELYNKLSWELQKIKDTIKNYNKSVDSANAKLYQDYKEQHNKNKLNASEKRSIKKYSRINVKHYDLPINCEGKLKIMNKTFNLSFFSDLDINCIDMTRFKILVDILKKLSKEKKYSSEIPKISFSQGILQIKLNRFVTGMKFKDSMDTMDINQDLIKLTV